MILIVTSRSDYTADYLVLRLNELQVPYVRFNTEDFPFDALSSLGSSQESIYLKKAARRVDLREIESVWYRRPEGPAFPTDFDYEARDFVNHECREFLLGMWRSLTCIWVNQPDKIRLSENKIEQLRRMKQMSMRVPETVITNDPSVVKDFRKNHRDVIAKTLRQSHGTLGDREYVIYTNAVLDDHLELLETIRYSPVIFQEKVEKASDIRVTVVGSELFATEIHSQENSVTSLDWRRDTLSLKHTAHNLPDEIEKQCLNLVKSYGLVFGALDLVRTPSSEYVFLELNPNGQWAWIEALTHQPIGDKLIEVLTNGSISEFGRH